MLSGLFLIEHPLLVASTTILHGPQNNLGHFQARVAEPGGRLAIVVSTDEQRAPLVLHGLWMQRVEGNGEETGPGMAMVSFYAISLPRCR